MDYTPLFNAIPHRFPILMVNQVVTLSENGIVTRNPIEKTNPFLDSQGFLSEFAGIELMAQSAALFLTAYYHRQGRTGSGLGYVIGVNPLEFFESLALGDEAEVEVTRESSLEQFHIFSARIKKQGQIMAQGELKIYADL